MHVCAEFADGFAIAGLQLMHFGHDALIFLKTINVIAAYLKAIYLSHQVMLGY
jgi:hypothetical protein